VAGSDGATAGNIGADGAGGGGVGALALVGMAGGGRGRGNRRGWLFLGTVGWGGVSKLE
jgi:hypothetical protein